MLLVRDPATGDWTKSVFGRVSDGFTRPVVMLDTDAQQVLHVRHGAEANGTIYVKTASFDNPTFVTGLGTVFMKDAASSHLNNVTSTKQNVNATTGLVMLAGNESASRYWWNVDPLGGGPTPTPTPTPGADPDAHADTAARVHHHVERRRRRQRALGQAHEELRDRHDDARP